MKIGQLIEYNRRNIFLKKHTENVGEKLVPVPSTKNQNRTFLQINSLKCYKFCSFFVSIGGLPKHIKAKVLITLKKVCNQYPCLIYSMIFEEKYFSRSILLTDQISFPNFLYFVRYWPVYVWSLFFSQSVTSYTEGFR